MTTYGSTDWLTEMGPVLTEETVDLLSPPLREAIWRGRDGLGFGIKHPWVNQPFAVMIGQANKQLTAKVGMTREYLAERNWSGYLFVVVERPWRMSTLQRLWEKGRITVEELRELLAQVWTDTEMPSDNLYEIDLLFHEAGFTTDDQEGFDVLPEEITIWRGGPEGGISWTLEKERAQWFAARFNQNHPLWEVTLSKHAALGYLSGRGESEIVLSAEAWHEHDIREIPNERES